MAKLATLPWISNNDIITSLGVSNDRLVVIVNVDFTGNGRSSLVVWDLAQHRFVAVDPTGYNGYVQGKWLVTQSASVPSVLRVYDTSQLPISPPA